MPLLSIIRFVFTLVSLAVLAAAAYLAWRWNQGELVLFSNGDVVRVRADWMIWLAGAMLLLSGLGRPLLVPLLAKADKRKTASDYGVGTQVTSPTGSELYVETLGNPAGPTVILTHGWAMDSTIWHYLKQDLAGAFRVIVWDLPGLGKSKAGKDAITLSAFALDLRTVIEHSAAAKVVLVGHSIGGMTIQTLAKEHAAFFHDRVAGAVLVNTTYTNPLKTMILSGVAQAIRFPLLEPIMRLMIVLQPLVWLSAWQSYLSGWAHVGNRLGFGKYVTHSQLEHTTLLSTRNAPGTIMRGNLAMFRWDATGALTSSPVPILVLAGAIDIVTKPDASVEIAKSTPAASLVPIEGVNHMGFVERPDVYNPLVAQFAASVLPSGAPVVG